MKLELVFLSDKAERHRFDSGLNPSLFIGALHLVPRVLRLSLVQSIIVLGPRTDVLGEGWDK